MTCTRPRRSLKFSQIGPPTAELAALECLKKSPYTYDGKNGVATFSQLFMIGSISYLQVTMTYMRAQTSSKFGQIRLLVPMATDRVIMEKTVLPLFLSCFSSRSFLYLQVMITCMRARTSSNFGQIRPRAAELWPLKDARNWFFAQYLENGWTEFNEILYTHYHWQDLYCYCKALFFANLQQSYSPW